MAVTYLNDFDLTDHEIANLILKDVKLGEAPAIPEPRDIYALSDGTPYYVTAAGVPRPIHEDSIQVVDVPDGGPLKAITNGRVVQLDIVLADAVNSGIISPELFTLLANATVLNVRDTLVKRDEDGSAAFGTIEANRVRILSSDFLTDDSAVTVGHVRDQIEIATQDLIATSNGRDWKDSVLLAYKTNVPLNTAPPPQAGITVDTNKSVLLLNQVDPTQNGPYTWNGTRLIRRADSTAEFLSAGAVYIVEAGDYANNRYQLATATFTLDETPLLFLDATDATIAGTNLVQDGRIISLAPAYDQSVNTRIADAIAPLQDATEVESLINQSLNNYGAVVEKSFPIGDGVATTFEIVHNLNTPFPSVVGFYGGQPLGAVDFKVDSANVITVKASLGGAPIASNSLIVVIQSKVSIQSDSVSGSFLAGG